MRLFPSFILVALALSSVSASAASPDARGEAKLAKAIAGRVAGKPVDCITLRNIQSSEIIDRTAILYRTVGGSLYVNVPRSGQTSLDDDDILVTKTWGSQLCSIDIVRLIDRVSRFETGFVGLGAFVPYTKVAAK